LVRAFYRLCARSAANLPSLALLERFADEVAEALRREKAARPIGIAATFAPHKASGAPNRALFRQIHGAKPCAQRGFAYA
jgi:hypothetical protein